MEFSILGPAHRTDYHHRDPHFRAGFSGAIRIRDPAVNRADHRRRTGDGSTSAAPQERINFDAIRPRGTVDRLGGGCQCVRLYYVRTATAKRLFWRGVVMVCIVRNSLIPGSDHPRC